MTRTERLTQYAIRQFPRAVEMGEDARDRALLLAVTVGKQAVRLGMTPEEASKWLQSAYGNVWVRLGNLNPGADMSDVRKAMLQAMEK